MIVELGKRATSMLFLLIHNTHTATRDYEALIGREIRFESRQTTANFQLVILNDGIVEDTEVFTVHFETDETTLFLLVGDAEATVEIIDNDGKKLGA